MMAARGPLASERRLSCCLTSAPTRTPAPRPQRRLAAPLPALGTGRGARRCRARAAGSWAAAGAGSPLSASRRAAQARGPQADTARRSAPLRSRSHPRPRPARSRRALEMLSELRRRLPPSEATHVGRSDVGLSRRSSPGTGKIVDLGPAMPNVLGCEQPKATGSSPTDRRWGLLVQPVGWDKSEGHVSLLLPVGICSLGTGSVSTAVWQGWEKEDSCGHLQRQRERERAAEEGNSRGIATRGNTSEGLPSR
ncbi:uncharacterized protein LOC127463938 isoform X2 [Manacus candei]|uniref:uncharacterized protein LOC127463938 isoform X2 n=1 Tax=Manacus candei TaxID=415023 RepID=UPI002227D7FF|nr:uncharacterized protein LOC127463938 isoform X2 [Manacus candei]